MLVSGLNVPIVNQEAKRERKEVLVNYFTDSQRSHNFYAFRFFFCEFLNLVNVLFQIYFMDFFLGGEFTSYGSEVLVLLLPLLFLLLLLLLLIELLPSLVLLLLTHHLVFRYSP